jgi:hypothetical protein
MGIEVISQLQKEIDTLKKKLDSTKTEAEKKVEELRKQFEQEWTQRKTAFSQENTITDAILRKAKNDGINLYLKSVLMGRPVDSFNEFKDVANVIEKAIKPADIADWLAEEFSNKVLEELELQLKVEGLFPRFKFPENRNTFSFPAKTGNASAYLIAPSDNAIESAIAGAKITFQTQRIKTLLGVTDQADNEMVTAIVQLVKQELIKSLARASEDAIVMGDTTITNANDPKKAFDGLLKYAKDAGNKVDAGGNAVTASLVAQARKLLGKYGLYVRDLAIIAPVNVAFQMLELPEVITTEKYGPKATILTGELGKLYGMPIIVSEYIPDNLDANGDVDPNNGDKTAVLIVNKEYFMVGDRGKAGIETERKIVSSTTLYVGYRDYDFKKVAVNATPVSAIVNVSKD